MATNRVLSAIFLAAGVLLVGACTSQPASRQSLDDRYFQAEARNYEKFQHEGQVVYCSTAETSDRALIPYVGHVRCISEASLRNAVSDWRRSRNAVAPPVIG